MSSKVFCIIATAVIGLAGPVWAETPQERLSTIKQEREKIKKRIAEGQDPQLFQKYLDEFDKEEKKLLKKVGAKKQKSKKSVAKKVPRQSRTSTARLVPNVQVDPVWSPEQKRTQILRMLEMERRKYLAEFSQRGPSPYLDQIRVNITYLEIQKSELEKTSQGQPQKMMAMMDGKKFQYKGHFQWRTESAQNRQGRQDERQMEQSFFRFRTYFSFIPNDRLTFNLTPQAAKGFGAVENGNTTSGALVSTELDFFEANVNYKVLDSLDFKLGRQELAYGDHLIIGSLPWANTGRSFDAAKFRFKYDFGWSDMVYSKITDNDTARDTTDDKDLFIFYNSFDFGSYFKTVDLYFIHQKDNLNAVDVNTFGLRAKGDIGPVFYRTENGLQSGAGVGDDGFQLNFEAGGRLGGGFKVSGEYAVAGSGYQQLYPTAHKFLGFADVLGRQNMEQMALHGWLPIFGGLSLRLDYHQFTRHRLDQEAVGLLGGALGPAGDSDDIGSEIDAVLFYKLPYGLKLQVGAAVFEPGQYMKDQNSGMADTTNFFYGQLNANF